MQTLNELLGAKVVNKWRNKIEIKFGKFAELVVACEALTEIIANSNACTIDNVIINELLYQIRYFTIQQIVFYLCWFPLRAIYFEIIVKFRPSSRNIHIIYIFTGVLISNLYLFIIFKNHRTKKWKKNTFSSLKFLSNHVCNRCLIRDSIR